MFTKHTSSSEKHIRYWLFSLLIVLALNAFGGGYYGLTGAKDIPVQWLEGSPFRSYFIPSLFLFVCIGGGSLYSAIMVIKKSRWACQTVWVCGSTVLLWLLAQVLIIGYVSWMQPATTGIVLVILMLNHKLSTYDH